MKKKIFLMLTLVLMLSCLFVITVNAELTTYDDAPSKTNIQVKLDDVVVFDDGFSCPSAYIFKDSDKTQDGSYWKLNIPNSMDFSFINSKTEKTYKFENIVELDIPQGITYLCRYAFYGCSTIKKVSIPDSVTTVGACAFENASSLEECVFEHTESSALTSLPQYIFSKNVSLKFFSMPDCITTLTGEGSHFTGCTNLGAVHLSKNLTTIQGTRNDRPSFDGCTNMYFVNEAFTPDKIPQKPTVYYFPSGLGNFANQCVFRSCTSLNDVLVLGTQITEIQNGYIFQHLPNSTIVFLGDMTKVTVTGWGVSKIFFANENDIDASSAGYSGKISAAYCNAEGNTEHLTEKTLSTEADCINPKMTADYCFCGSIIGTPKTVGDALGHDLTGNAYYVFESLMVAGKTCVDCGRCDYTEETTHEKAIVVAMGYSVNTYNEEKSFSTGYMVDKEMLKKYESTKGVKVSFSFGFNAQSTFNYDGTLNSFAIVAPIGNVGTSDSDFSAFSYKMRYENDEHIGDLIVIAAYAVEKGEGGESLSLLNGVDGNFEAVSYNTVLEKAN